MSGGSYPVARGRSSKKQSHFALPHTVLNHINYIRLSAHAVKLLNDLGSQYRGFNNGDLCAAWTIMKTRGWKSRDTLFYAVKELLYYGFITVTRQGGRHKPTLYGLTWREINECKGKLDPMLHKQSKLPSNGWKEEVAVWIKPPRKKIMKKKTSNTQSEYIDTQNEYKKNELTRIARAKKELNTHNGLMESVANVN